MSTDIHHNIERLEAEVANLRRVTAELVRVVEAAHGRGERFTPTPLAVLVQEAEEHAARMGTFSPEQVLLPLDAHHSTR